MHQIHKSLQSIGVRRREPYSSSDHQQGVPRLPFPLDVPITSSSNSQHLFHLQYHLGFQQPCHPPAPDPANA
eukprot:scaffold80672_cov19-Tisochrysis_lutea.AAC.1